MLEEQSDYQSNVDTVYEHLNEIIRKILWHKKGWSRTYQARSTIPVFRPHDIDAHTDNVVQADLDLIEKEISSASESERVARMKSLAEAVKVG